MTADRGTPAIELVERALELLLAAPPRVHAVHLAGSAPFALAMMVFLVDLGTRGRTRMPLVAASGVVALLYLLLKVSQNAHARLLLRQVAGRAADSERRHAFRAARAQVLQQPHALWMLPLAALALLPYPWVSAYFHSLSVTGESRSAFRLASLWPLQNGIALLLVQLCGFIVFVDVWITLILLPMLLRALLGIETAASLSPTGWFDVAPLAAAAAMTYLIVSPLQRAVHVIRVVEGVSRASGGDLLARLRGIRVSARAAAVAVVLALVAAAGAAADGGDPGAPALAEASLRPEPLDRQLDLALARPEFDWRRKETLDLEQDPSWLAAFWRSVGVGISAIGEALGDFVEWIARWFRGRETSPGGIGEGSVSAPPWRILVLLALALAVVGAAFAWRARKRRRAAVEAVAATVEAAPVELEERAADRLASDEWLELASELERAGDLRGAARAVHLAALSWLSRAGWVQLAPAKTNRDYERELGRRARSFPELARAWSGAVSGIEPVWYGSHPASRELVAELRTRVRELEAHAPAA